MVLDDVDFSMDNSCISCYPKNIQDALKKFWVYLCTKEYGKHIIKTYRKGFIGVPSELLGETVIDNNPLNDIFHKYYSDKGDFTLGIDNIRNCIVPAYFCNDGNFYIFTEEMLSNDAMWEEMANSDIRKNTYEYREDLDLDTQYAIYRKDKYKGTKRRGNKYNFKAN